MSGRITSSVVFLRGALYRQLKFLAAQVCRACTLVSVIAPLLSGRAAAQAEPCVKAASLFQAHRWAEAAQAYAQCEQSSPSSLDAHLYRGKALVNVGDFTDAAAELHSYLAVNSQSDDAMYLLGYVHFRQDQPRESLETFARANRLRAPQASDLKIAALECVLLNDYISAARYLEQSLALDPTDNE